MSEFESQMLQHMMDTNTKLGAIDAKLEQGEKTHNEIKTLVGTHSQILATVPALERRVGEVEDEVDDCRAVRGEISKFKYVALGIGTGIALVAGSVSSWLRDNFFS